MWVLFMKQILNIGADIVASLELSIVAVVITSSTKLSWRGSTPGARHGRHLWAAFGALGVMCADGSRLWREKKKHTGRRGSDTRHGAFSCHKFAVNGPYFRMEARIKQHATHEGHKAAAIAARRVSQLPPARLSQEPEHTPT